MRAAMVILVAGGPVFAIYELITWKRARRAAAIMRERETEQLTSSSSP